VEDGLDDPAAAAQLDQLLDVLSGIWAGLPPYLRQHHLNLVSNPHAGPLVHPLQAPAFATPHAFPHPASSPMLDAEAVPPLRPSRGLPRVLIHCQAGVSRAPTVATALLMRLLRLPLAQCLLHIQRLRPVCNINPGFRRVLARLDAAEPGRPCGC